MTANMIECSKAEDTSTGAQAGEAMSAVTTRPQALASQYQNEILSNPERFPLVECPVEDAFCDGVYARSTYLKQGTLAVGATHRKESFFMVRSGTLLVTTDDGDRVVGPGFMAVTLPGTKRIAYAFTDVIVANFHANPDEIRDTESLWEAYTLQEESKWPG